MRLITVVCILAFVGNVSAVFISTFLIKSEKEICLTINEEDNQSDSDSEKELSFKLEKDFSVEVNENNYLEYSTESLNQQRNYFNRSDCYLFHYQSIIDYPPEVIC
jgi:uncharacterized membrane protein YgaE (UPF0421/DUF939 family)